MKCPECKIEVHVYRIIDGKDICHECAPSIMSPMLTNVRAVYGRFGGTAAHLKDIKTRRLAEDGRSVVRYRPKTYIF